MRGKRNEVVERSKESLMEEQVIANKDRRDESERWLLAGVLCLLQPS